MNDEAAKVIGLALGAHVDLFDLALGGNPDLGDEGVLSLLQVAESSSTRKLGVLSLKNNSKITGVALARITTLAPLLESLEVRSALILFFFFVLLPRLNHPKLSGTSVTEDSLKHLYELSRLDRFKANHLSLSLKSSCELVKRCPRLGVGTIRELLGQMLKECGGGSTKTSKPTFSVGEGVEENGSSRSNAEKGETGTEKIDVFEGLTKKARSELQHKDKAVHAKIDVEKMLSGE